jgi:ubiquinone biosynthesis protein COQ9
VLSFNEYEDVVLLKNLDEEFVSNKRRRKKIRLTMPERYKPRRDLVKKLHPLAVAWFSLIEEINQTLNDKSKKT